MASATKHPEKILGDKLTLERIKTRERCSLVNLCVFIENAGANKNSIVCKSFAYDLWIAICGDLESALDGLNYAATDLLGMMSAEKLKRYADARAMLIEQHSTERANYLVSWNVFSEIIQVADIFGWVTNDCSFCNLPDDVLDRMRKFIDRLSESLTAAKLNWGKNG